VANTLRNAVAETAGLLTPEMRAAAAHDATAKGPPRSVLMHPLARAATVVTHITLVALYAWGGLYPRLAYVGAHVFAVYTVAALAFIFLVYCCEAALAATAPYQPDTPGLRRRATRAARWAAVLYVVTMLALVCAWTLQAGGARRASTLYGRGTPERTNDRREQQGREAPWRSPPCCHSSRHRWRLPRAHGGHHQCAADGVRHPERCARAVHQGPPGPPAPAAGGFRARRAARARRRRRPVAPAAALAAADGARPAAVPGGHRGHRQPRGRRGVPARTRACEHRLRPPAPRARRGRAVPPVAVAGPPALVAPAGQPQPLRARGPRPRAHVGRPRRLRDRRPPRRRAPLYAPGEAAGARHRVGSLG